jgi:DNA-binding protein H-NS
LHLQKIFLLTLNAATLPQNHDGAVMERADLGKMSIDDLWSLHVEVARLLQERIKSEKLALEERLRILKAPIVARRPYPPVSPKFRNPDKPSETWSGRGKRPRWLVAQLKSGKRIDDFRIRKLTKKRQRPGEGQA